ncbi:MAG: serine hydrolase domain-containing protein [Bacteroidota bacterium]
MVGFLSVIISFNVYAQDVNTSLIDDIEKYMRATQIPGAMISIVNADSVIFVGGLGYADARKKELVNEHHLFRQGSISKSFTAMGLFHLLQSTPYDLNSSIREIDPDIPFFNLWADTEPVRISHVLEHTSGFEDFHLHAMYSRKKDQRPSLKDMLKDHQQSLHSRWPPGTRKAYANPNYIVAGHLIEVLSGLPFEEYIQKQLLEEMGMQQSGYYFTPPGELSFATGHRREDSDFTSIPFATINGSPAGDFCANAKDMASFLQYMLSRDSSIFDRTEFDRIETPKTSLAARHGLEYGYGLGNYSIWKNGYLFHGHGGQIDGFAARYVYSRAADLGVAIAMNRNGNENAFVDEILGLLVPEIRDDSVQRIILPIPDTLANAFTGFYEFSSPKSKLIAFTDRMLAGISLDFQEDKVITRTLLGKPKDSLFYAGNNQFYLNDEGEPSVIMLTTNTGQPVLWINDNYTIQTSRTRRLLIFLSLLFSFLLVFAFFIYSLFWLAKHSFWPSDKSRGNHLILFGFGIAFVLMFLGFGLSISHPHAAQHANFSSILMYTSSYSCVILSVTSLFKWNKLEGKKRFKVFYALSSIGTLVISAYLWQIGLIGLKLWSY